LGGGKPREDGLPQQKLSRLGTRLRELKKKKKKKKNKKKKKKKKKTKKTEKKKKKSKGSLVLVFARRILRSGD